MTGETISVAEAAAAKNGDDVQGRQRSKIAFPYADLKSAIELAEAIHGNAGLGECDDDQLAAWTNQSAKSSGFRVQIGAARLFGLLEGEGRKHKVAELGRAVVDPNQARVAKAQAFLRVPLFKAIFDNYRGGVLPSQAAALERDMVTMGVGDKVKDRARQVFERSAEQAGFFEHGKNRLVMPAVVAGIEPAVEDDDKNKRKSDGNDGDGGGLNLDPLLIALLKKIPPSGQQWPAAQRVRWFRTFAMNVSQIYDDEAEPVEMKIEVEK